MPHAYEAELEALGTVVWAQHCMITTEEHQTAASVCVFLVGEKERVAALVGSTHLSGERTSSLIPGTQQFPLPSSPPCNPMNTQHLVAQIRRSELPHVP